MGVTVKPGRISYAEAAEILGCHVSNIPKRIRKGELHSEGRRGASLDRAEVEALAARRRARREEIEARGGKRRPVDSRPDMDHEWLTPKDVAEILGITEQGVTQRLRRGTMRGVSHRRKWWVRADHLEHAEGARPGP